APREHVVAAAEAYRLDASPVTRLLVALRGLGRVPPTLRALFTGGAFTILAETPGDEIVVGTYGRFWAIAERRNMIAPVGAEEFVAFARPGWAKAAMNFRFEAVGPQETRLVTETRVLACDEAARRRFTLYWLLIGPFSGVLRRVLLRGIRAAAV